MYKTLKKSDWIFWGVVMVIALPFLELLFLEDIKGLSPPIPFYMFYFWFIVTPFGAPFIIGALYVLSTLLIGSSSFDMNTYFYIGLAFLILNGLY